MLTTELVEAVAVCCVIISETSSQKMSLNLGGVPSSRCGGGFGFGFKRLRGGAFGACGRSLRKVWHGWFGFLV